ncbi:hypothetical protein ABQF26_36965, partial [Mycolicibacterium elephantis]
MPITTNNAADTAMTRSVRAGISPGYWRDRRIGGSAHRRARLETVAERNWDRIVIPGAGGMVGR